MSGHRGNKCEGELPERESFSGFLSFLSHFSFLEIEKTIEIREYFFKLETSASEMVHLVKVIVAKPGY